MDASIWNREHHRPGPRCSAPTSDGRQGRRRPPAAPHDRRRRHSCPCTSSTPPPAGTGLVLELAGAAFGLLLGLAAAALLKNPPDDTGTVRTHAGTAYARPVDRRHRRRLTFSYGASHWYTNALGRWMADHQVSVDALTDTPHRHGQSPLLLGRTGGPRHQAQQRHHTTHALAA